MRGRGFIVEEDEALGERRAGKAVLLLGEDERAAVLRAIADGDDAVAVLGSNRKLLIFPLAELPVMAKGRGVLLQRYRDAKLADITTFTHGGRPYPGAAAGERAPRPTCARGSASAAKSATPCRAASRSATGSKDKEYAAAWA